jgi:hypothetical protein
MKNLIPKITVFLLCFALAMPAFSQNTIQLTEKMGQKPPKTDRGKIPMVVLDAFSKEFSNVANETWYGYPKFDDANDWYGYNPYLFEYVSPDFYVVEFDKDNAYHRVIYSKEGKKVAVHKKMTSELPKAITDAISKTRYRNWAVTKEKEEIFRDLSLDKIKVYKVEVKNSRERHQLFYSAEGNLLKDKTIKL